MLVAALLRLDAVRDAFGIGMPNWTDLCAVIGLGVMISITIEFAKCVLCRLATDLATGGQSTTVAANDLVSGSRSPH